MERHLVVRRSLNLLFHHLQPLHLTAQAVDLVLDAGGLGFSVVAVFAIGPVQGSSDARRRRSGYPDHAGGGVRLEVVASLGTARADPGVKIEPFRTKGKPR